MRADRESSVRVVILDITADRPDAPDYHRLIRTATAAVREAVTRTGAHASVVLTADVVVERTVAEAAAADALVVMGGEDVAPWCYRGRTVYRGQGRHYPVADTAQIAAVRHAVATRAPVLGICRGHQVINVALGGTLVQHLGDDDAHVRHGVSATRMMVEHPVAVDGGLRELLGAAEIVVRSAHHQAVDTLGDSLEVAATAPDGVIEAVRHREAPVLGVQWHPEDAGSPHGQLDALLGWLVHAARGQVRAPSGTGSVPDARALR